MFVQIHSRSGMLAQDRCWRHGADLALKTELHRCRFPAIWHDREYLLRFKNLTHGHRERLLRHLRDVRKPRLPDLLLAARIIKADNNVWFFGIEIRRRIVKSDVPIFTNAKESDINGRRSQLSANTVRDLSRIGGITVEQVIVNNSSFSNQLL